MDKKNSYSYENHREYWKTKPYLEQLFGKNVDIKSNRVLDLLDKIDRIPKSKVYTIAAYGSLLNPTDIFRTMPTADNFRKGIIYGYERVFNVGNKFSGCVLNIKKSITYDALTCHFIDISYEDLPYYILREGWYDIKVLTSSEYETKISNPVLTVLGKQEIVNNSIGIEPQLNYVHLCLDGIKEIAGWEGVQHFLDDTTCYSNYHNDYITVKKWLDNLDISQYFITNNYNSR